MEVIFYSTHCKKCGVVEILLKQKGIDYIESNDVQTVLDLGFKNAPLLSVDGKIMEFSEAITWLKGQ